MNRITEPSRNIPVVTEVDVLIAGGGTAGAVAAIAAARGGAQTLIVEQFGFLGGTQTAALVAPICPNYDPDGIPLTRGIGQEIWERLSRKGGTVATLEGRYLQKDWPWFDPEMLKYLLEEMVEESGAGVLYHAWISDVVLEEGCLRGLIIESKSGRQSILAKCIVDATGDADVAFRSGVPCESGRKSDGLNQAVSLRFHLGNVDLKRLLAFLRENGMPDIQEPTVSYAAGAGEKNIEPVIRKAIEDGIVPEDVMRYFQFYTVTGRPGEISFNCPEVWNLNPTNAFDLTRIQIEGRKLIQQLIHFCKTCLPGFENSYLVFTAPMIGVRSSRRIIGEYILTEEDVLEGKRFPDAVARNSWPPDIHSPKKGEKLVFKTDLVRGDYVEIPYRCMVPLKVDHLLVAGRCISTTFEAQSAIRISRTCQTLGQAAGTAAALCIENQVTPRNLNTEQLTEQLKRDGVF